MATVQSKSNGKNCGLSVEHSHGFINKCAGLVTYWSRKNFCFEHSSPGGEGKHIRASSNLWEWCFTPAGILHYSDMLLLQVIHRQWSPLRQSLAFFFTQHAAFWQWHKQNCLVVDNLLLKLDLSVLKPHSFSQSSLKQTHSSRLINHRIAFRSVYFGHQYSLSQLRCY